jgi:hypothetical protein
VIGAAADTLITDAAYLTGGRRVAVGQTVISQVPSEFGLSYPAAIALKTGGGAWGPAFTGPLYPPTSNDTPVPTYAQLNSIDATAGGDVAWAAGTEFSTQQGAVKRSLIYLTADGGSTWTTDTAAPDTLLTDISAVAAADTTAAYATTRVWLNNNPTGTRTVLRRAAGTWQAMASQLGIGFQANAVDAYDANRVVVVGNAGRIAYSSNAAGLAPTWAEFTAPGANDLYGVQMLGPDSWIVVGGNETILRYSSSGGSTPAGSSALAAPTVSITSPSAGFAPATSLTISGTAVDVGVGVLKVDVQIQRSSDGKYWDGSTASWTSTLIKNQATGTSSWSYSFNPGNTSPVIISAEAKDGMDNQSGLQTVLSAGATPPSTPLSVYRFYNMKNGSHFYTADAGERDSVIKNLSKIYVLDGTAYTVNTSNPANNQWLYRFYNKKNGSHFYTASESEKASVIKNLSATYSYDGPAYKVCAGSPPPNSKTVWRFYNKKNGSHFYTADEGEKASVIKNLSATYSLDGPGFFLAP